MAYGPRSWDIDYSRIAYDPVAGLLFLDGDGDRVFTTATDARGCKVSDVNGNGQIDPGEDFALRALLHAEGEKSHYSLEAIRAASVAEVFSGWPEEIDTLDDAEAYWKWRESTRYYDRLAARRPDLKLLIAAGREDHVQTAPGKPHIRQAFDGFARNGLWVKLNPSPSQVAAVSPAAASLDLPDLPANRPPADWYDYSYAYPEGVADNIFQAAATREMAELINNPTGSVAAVVNAASYDNGVAPGSLVSIFGSNLVSEIASASTVPLPHALRGAYVLVNGLPAPLLYVSPNQINLQIPWEVTPGEATFEVNGVQAAVTVIEAGPGIFKLLGERAVLEPVRPGAYATIYLTGQGPVEYTPPTGAATPDTPLSWATKPVSVTVGGKPAKHQFAGLAPRMVGVMQLNLVVPDLLPGAIRLWSRSVERPVTLPCCPLQSPRRRTTEARRLR